MSPGRQLTFELQAIPVRVAISGCAGTGKSTLAVALADALGIACIPESFDPLFEYPGSFKGPPECLRRRFFRVLDAKEAQEAACGDFVVDRCPVDLFNLWMAKGLWKSADAETMGFHHRCRSLMVRYDRLVLLPHGVLPLRQLGPEAGSRRRVMNPWVQFHNQAGIIGLSSLWLASEKLLPVPASLPSSGARVRYLLSRLRDPVAAL